MKAKINFDGNWLSEINVDSHSYSLNERIKRSSKIFLMLFAFAVTSILIPVLHFFLVPTFLILSIFLSYHKYKEVLSIDLRSFSCPVCKKSLNSKIVGLKEDNLTVRLHCENCRKNLTVVIDERLDS